MKKQIATTYLPDLASIHAASLRYAQRKFYEIRVYKMKTAEQVTATDDYLKTPTCPHFTGWESNRLAFSNPSPMIRQLIKLIICHCALYIAGCMDREQNPI